jgi:hypothetical protein
VEYGIKQNAGLVESLKKALSNNEMTGTADRQKFRQSLNYPQKNGVFNVHGNTPAGLAPVDF